MVSSLVRCVHGISRESMHVDRMRRDILFRRTLSQPTVRVRPTVFGHKFVADESDM